MASFADILNSIYRENIARPAGTYAELMKRGSAGLLGAIDPNKSSQDYYSAGGFGKNSILNEREMRTFEDDPLKATGKVTATTAANTLAALMGAGQAKQLLPLIQKGGTKALSAEGLKILGSVGAKRSPIGALAGFGGSQEGQEGGSTIAGAGLAAISPIFDVGAGRAARVLRTGGKKLLGVGNADVGTNMIDIDNIRDIKKLSPSVRRGLKNQAKAAGFLDDSVGESKSIQNYLKNRGFAGNTPSDTLENLTQEFARAAEMKQKGLKEIGGLSSSYIQEAKDKFAQSLKNRGMTITDENSKIYANIIKTFDNPPSQSAKDLDDLIQQWYKAGLTAKGEQKLSAAGLYEEAARALRDTMRKTVPDGLYDQGLRILNQVFDIEDAGVVSKAAKEAASSGFNLPGLAGAGFTSADIKTSGPSNLVARTRAALGRTQERGIGNIGTPPKALSGLQGLFGSALAGQADGDGTGGGQEGGIQTDYSQYQDGPDEIEDMINSYFTDEGEAGSGGMGDMGQGAGSGMGNNDEFKKILAIGVLSGEISGAEANAVISLLGMDKEEDSEEVGLLDNAINELERLYGAGTEDSLSRGDYSTGLGGIASSIGIGFNKAFNQDFMDKKASYDQQRALAVGIINKAREAGVLNEGEYLTMIENMPNERTTEKVARDWFNNARRLLSAKKGTSSTQDETGLSDLLGL